MNKMPKIKKQNQPSVSTFEKRARSKFNLILNLCKKAHKDDKGDFVTLNKFEELLKENICELACILIELFLACYHINFDIKVHKTEEYLHRKKPTPRTIKSFWGPVKYWRSQLINKKGGKGSVFFPLDSSLGLTQDNFGQGFISLAIRISTMMSFEAAVKILKITIGHAPSADSIKQQVIGVAQYASPFMDVSVPKSISIGAGGSEILIIEIDGKATPTATDSELNKRRQKHGKNCNKNCCKRHRSKDGRSSKGKKIRREVGDKSKNGRSITLVAMYTLTVDEDGKFHGPFNKKIYGSYSPRKIMMNWAASQAKKRGFNADSKDIHIIIDGEACLQQTLESLFSNATFALDIYHLEEHIWKAGRKIFSARSSELQEWVDHKLEMLYTDSNKLISCLKKSLLEFQKQPEYEPSAIALDKLLNYMVPRKNMLNYAQYIKNDLPIASGVIEGAARYVIGERMDCSGMRWIPERAECILQLRCIEINGDWEKFFNYYHNLNRIKMKTGEPISIRCKIPLPIAKTFEEFKSELKVAA